MYNNIIELTDLTKKYGSFTAVDNLNLSIKKGEIFGLLGPNGAGKSTTILMILGLTEPTSGIVNVCSINSTKNPVEVKQKVGYLPEDVGFYDDRTGLENLIFTARLNNLSYNQAKQRALDLLKRVGLSDEANKKAGKYSRGMRQRLGLADVLIKNPEIIILDEPTLGIDPSGMKEFIDLISKLSKEDGITVLLSSHHLHQVQVICDRVGLFVEGKLIADGNIEELSQKLFTKGSYIIELIATNPNNKQEKSTQWLQNILQNIQGISKIQYKEDKFQIECSSDISSEIAKAIIISGNELHYLTKKEFGLDDIYYRYFEGMS